MDEAAAPVPGDQDWFLTGWRIYRKVLDLNYMHHREVYDTLRAAVSAAPQGFAFLDIACGDAAGTARALAGSGVGSYAGIDISRPALDIAARELADLGCPISLIESDLRKALEEWYDPVDVAWLGQSLHHFQPEEKRAILRAIRRALVPGGTFMLWEPTLLPGEDRHGWLGRLAARRSTGRISTTTSGMSCTITALRRISRRPRRLGLRWRREPALGTGAQYLQRRD